MDMPLILGGKRLFLILSMIISLPSTLIVAVMAKFIFSGILLSIIFAFSSIAQQNDFPILTGHYLGQKPPEKTPEIFARIINNISGIVRLRSENGKYAKPEILTPNLKGTYPYVAPDESYIVFCSGKQRDLVVSFHQPDNS